MIVSDRHGYGNPHGYGPQVSGGTGTGMRLCTPTKPVPLRQVWGYVRQCGIGVWSGKLLHDHSMFNINQLRSHLPFSHHHVLKSDLYPRTWWGPPNCNVSKETQQGQGARWLRRATGWGRGARCMTAQNTWYSNLPTPSFPVQDPPSAHRYVDANAAIVIHNLWERYPMFIAVMMVWHSSQLWMNITTPSFSLRDSLFFFC